LTNEHNQKVEMRVQTLLQAMKLKALHNNLAPTRTGGIPLTDNTLTSYEKHYDSLYVFFGHIKDFESLLMLRREPLEYFPSMNPTSLVLHYKWKTGKEGTPLLDEHGNTVKDLDGNNITCVGTWKSPENLEQCRSTISTLHKARNMIGAYQKPCPDCIELDKMEKYHGCQSHCGNARLWSSGNPNNSLECYNWSVGYIKSMSAYRPNGDSPLTPDELKLICNKLMAGNMLWEFELYVIILLCCRMLLREDEIGKMAYSTVNSGITVVKSNDCVEGIAMQVQGKVDPNPMTLMMWFDHEFPEFCLVWHLLAWLRLSQIQDSYFFPSYNFLNTTIVNDASWNGFCGEPISYSDVLSAWKNLCSTILEQVGRFGFHSGRKTGYLFGVWGGAQDTDLMLSARHKTVKNAMIYKCDAAFLLALAQENMNSLTLRTPKWRSIYCEQHQLAIVVNTNSRPHFKHIYQLATIFVEKNLGIVQQTLQKCSRAISDKLMKYSHQYGCLDDSRNELQEILKSLDASIGG
jgi:hypothetical protein